jgi:phage N-6-adenine-methyltransferase
VKGLKQVMSSARTGAGRDDWQTPPEVLDCVRRIAPIDLDPCTAPGNPTGASRFFTAQDDALSIEDWNPGGLVYVNWPYSQARAWAKAVRDQELLTTHPILCLVPARTDTRWWRMMLGPASAVAFWRGRIGFVGAPVTASGKRQGAPFPSAMIAFNLAPRRLELAFRGVADVMERVR